MDRRRVLIIGLLGLILGVVLWRLGVNQVPTFKAPRIDFSGKGFPMGNLSVLVDYGSSFDREQLYYMVVRAFPQNATQQQILNDPRFDLNLGGVPRLRHADGSMREVQTDGRVYLFIGDELRTLRVQMDQHSDPAVLNQAKSLEEMWELLQRFRVP